MVSAIAPINRLLRRNPCLLSGRLSSLRNSFEVMGMFNCKLLDKIEIAARNEANRN